MWLRLPSVACVPKDERGDRERFVLRSFVAGDVFHTPRGEFGKFLPVRMESSTQRSAAAAIQSCGNEFSVRVAARRVAVAQAGPGS